MGRKKLEIAVLTDFSPKHLKESHSTSIGRALKSGNLTTRQKEACITEMHRRLLPIVTFFGKGLFHGDEAKAREKFDEAFFFDCINKIDSHWKDNGSFEAWCSKNIKNMMLGELRVKMFKNHRWQVSLSSVEDNEDNGALDRTQAQILNLRDESILMDEDDIREKKSIILGKAMNKLSKKQKEILNLRFYKNMKPDEIQDEMDLSVREYTKLLTSAKEDLEDFIYKITEEMEEDKKLLFKKVEINKRGRKKKETVELQTIVKEDEEFEEDPDLIEFDNILPEVQNTNYY